MNSSFIRPEAVDLVDAKIAQVLAHPATSNWLKASIRSALARDPVDAVDDAHSLLALLEERAAAILD